MKKYTLLIFFLIIFVTGCSEKKAPYPADIKRFDTDDITFLSDDTYDVFTPWFNPFTEIQIRLELTSPSGREFSVPGFFDGDGDGGMRGRIFKVRVSPDEIGSWHWQTKSSLPELDQLTGSFEVKDTIEGVFSNGPVSILQSDQKRFSFANQKPLFLIGKFLDIEQPAHLQFSHTFLSEKWDDRQREQLLDHHVSLGVNKMNIYLANKGDYNAIPTTPWLGTSSLNIKSRFDLNWWHQYEKWIERLRDEDIIAHLWFFADDSSFNLLTETEREQLITYGMARLSGYANTIFTLALEWQEDFTVNKIRSAGTLTQQNNPWRRLLSVHSLSVIDSPEDSTVFFDDDWLDFIEIQTGFISHEKIYPIGLQFRKKSRKPMILEEFSFGENTDEQRINTWAALLTAPAGIGTGSGIKSLSTFLRTIDITQFTPTPELITSGNAYAAQSDSGQTLIYIFNKGPLTLTTKKISSNNGQWFNPRNGEYSGSIFVLDTGSPITPPTDQDWVLLLSP